MDFQTLFDAFGTPAIFIAACFYLLKRIEQRDSIRDKEARERELALAKRLNESEQYMRDTLVAQLEKSNAAIQASNAAIRAMVAAVEDIQRPTGNGVKAPNPISDINIHQ